jgi:hypothetical protein
MDFEAVGINILEISCAAIIADMYEVACKGVGRVAVVRRSLPTDLLGIRVSWFGPWGSVA